MYDFSGYATKNDLECGDGRIIRKNAFESNDNTRVPLVWQHIHDTPDNILGHADLENLEDGVYAYCSFNETPSGQNAKELVKHGDITAMSIYANKLKQSGKNVIHGLIREVSLVIAPANPGAMINPLSIAHSDGSYTDVEDEAIITTGEDFVVHSDEDQVDPENYTEADAQAIIDSMDDKQYGMMHYLVERALNISANAMSHSDDEEDDAEDSKETIGDILKTLNKKQRLVFQFLLGQALNEGKAEEVQHSDLEDDMKFNAFEDAAQEGYQELSHTDIVECINSAKSSSNGSLRQEFLAHGIENLDVLYPEAKLVGQNPELISRDMTWVDKVWGSLRKTPYSRTRSVAANITDYEARARGYVKGTKKVEEVLSLLSRVTVPQTVYKIQKIDRDDVIDITDLDIVAWVKTEMRIMLNEEIVRAVLVGDDRPSSDQSYINPEHIRPIYQDSDVYTIHEEVTIPVSATFNDIADAIIETSVLSRKNYMGSGLPTMYASTDVITRMLLAKDQLGHRMYRNEGELAAALRVKEIVEVPIFDGVTRTASITTESGGQTITTQEERKLLCLIVNLSDYALGSDKKGEVTLFDDFDINFNKYEYLIETRCSGALIKPYSAIAIETAGDLPFTFGTVSGMYKNRKNKGTTGDTGE